MTIGGNIPESRKDSSAPAGSNAADDAARERSAKDNRGFDSITAWLDMQREMMDRWLSASHAGAASAEARAWWQSISKDASPAAQELAAQLAQLGPNFLSGAGDVLGELYGVELGASPDGLHNFARLAMGAAPIGYFREHQQRSQILARALDDYRMHMQQLANEVARIHTDALEALAQQLQTLAQSGAPVDDPRKLYDLWIANGEQAFSRHAQDAHFAKLQAAVINAGLRVRAAQQDSVEYFLKQLDLPTRAELNSLHQKMAALRAEIESLQIAFGADSQRHDEPQQSSKET